MAPSTPPVGTESKSEAENGELVTALDLPQFRPEGGSTKEPGGGECAWTPRCSTSPSCGARRSDLRCHTFLKAPVPRAGEESTRSQTTLEYSGQETKTPHLRCVHSRASGKVFEKCTSPRHGPGELERVLVRPPPLSRASGRTAPGGPKGERFGHK